jgi:hypothetical protein
VIAILEEKWAEVMAKDHAGHFIHEWQEGDQVRQLIIQDTREPGDQGEKGDTMKVEGFPSERRRRNERGGTSPICAINLTSYALTWFRVLWVGGLAVVRRIRSPWGQKTHARI